MIKVGIVGGAGYTAGELIRLLVNHSQIELDFVYSTSNAGNYIYQVHQDLLGTLNLKFTDSINKNVDVLFLCLGHGNSTAFLENNSFSNTTKIIDLSNDFRLKADAIFQGKEFVYGLPELQKEQIKRVFIGGLATEYCVKNTILDALKFGFVSYFLSDASRGINSSEGDVQKAIDSMQNFGVKKIELLNFLF